MSEVMHGTVHGRTIEFEHDIGVTEGQQVQVVILSHAWTNAQNARRVFLIEKDIRGEITPEEATELEDLQDRLRRYRRDASPLPLAETARLLNDLERKAQSNS